MAAHKRARSELYTAVDITAVGLTYTAAGSLRCRGRCKLRSNVKGYHDIVGDGGSRILEQVAAQRTRIADGLAGVRHLVAVGSGKGGVGKSTLTLHLAGALRARGLRIGILDADFNGPSQARMAGVQGALFVPGSQKVALPIASVRPLRKQVAVAFSQQRLMARLTSFFGLLSLVLASIGLYGVTAFNAGRRINEIGVRLALGATRGQVVRLVVRGAFRLILFGLIIGSAADVCRRAIPGRSAVRSEPVQSRGCAGGRLCARCIRSARLLGARASSEPDVA